MPLGGYRGAFTGPLRDGRLSWHGWLTHSGQRTNTVVTCQPYIGHRSRKVCQPKTDVLTTESHCSVPYFTA